ncbi:transposase, partial [Rhodococcus sp. WS4]
DPVAAAARSAAANSKAARKTTTDGDLPVRSYQGLLEHLATLTRNDIRYGEGGPTVPTLTEPTDTQRRAFDLLGTTIPLNLQ